MDLLVALLIVAGTAVVLFRRASQDLEGNRPYVYCLGALLAVTFGLIVTGRYDHEVVQWALPLLFFLFILLPHLLVYTRDQNFQSGSFGTAALLQKLVLVFVWSRNERDVYTLAKAAQEVRAGNLSQAQNLVKDVEGRGGREAAVTAKLIQVRILIAGQNRTWRSVVREFDQLTNMGQKVWTPVLIYAAQGAIETDRFRRAERVLSALEDRSLTTQQELAVYTVRLGYFMLQGQYEAGELLVHRIEDEFGELIPESYAPYWKARGCQEQGRFDQARTYYTQAQERLDAEQYPTWDDVINERLRELQIEENRRASQSTYRYQGEELDEPVDEWEQGGARAETVVESEPMEAPSGQQRPPSEVIKFIQQVNQMPWGTTVLLTLIGFTFSVMMLGVNKEYPDGSEIWNATQDPVSLLVFGMKSDFMMDETYQGQPKPAGARLREASRILSKDLTEVQDLNSARKKLNASLESSGQNVQVGEQQMRNLWVEARYAEMFGLNEKGEIQFPKDQYWRLATCTLLHIGLFHILLNGYALWILGKLMENIYGLGDFLVIYLISGLTGSIASWKFGISQSSAGASGAIFGLLGAAITLTLIKRQGIPEQIRRRLAWPLLFWTAVNLALGFVISGIDNAGHIGGLIGGLVFGYLLPSKAESGGERSTGAVHFVKWSFLAVLVMGYLWSIYKAFLFIRTYIDQIP